MSLTAHAALLVAAVGGGGAGATQAAARGAGAAGGEQLHWIGVGEGSGSAVARRTPGARPPIAYVVPGHGGLRAHARVDQTSGPGVRRDPSRQLTGRDGPPPAPDVVETTLRQPVAVRRVPRSLRLRTAAPAELVVPDAQATLLVAGVLSAAPDLTRRAARPEDFVPTPAAELVADLMAHTGALAPSLLHPDVHMHDLPIPLVNNPPPAYPDVLARAHVDGHVVVEFLIDSAGVVNLGTLHVVESTDALFTQAVRSVLPRLHFMPAQLGEHAVGVTVRQPFVFTMRSGL